MRDPAYCANPTQTVIHRHEREKLTNWVRDNGTDPLTRAPCSFTDIKPDAAMKQLLQDRRIEEVRKELTKRPEN